MTHQTIVPRRVSDELRFPSLGFRMPRFLTDFFDADEDLVPMTTQSGLSVSEDDKHIYVEAAVPGIEPSKVEVTYDRGELWIRGKAEDEVKDRKYRQKSSKAFAYGVDVPSYADDTKEPAVVNKNGMLTVTFNKQPEAQPKKLKVTTE